MRDRLGGNRTARAVALVAVAAALAMWPGGASAQNARYTYTDLGYGPGTNSPQLNNVGGVLVKVANNLRTGPTAQDNVVPGGYTYHSGGAINDAGVVAFRANGPGNVQGIYTRAGRGSLPPITDPPVAVATTANYRFFSFSNAVPAISNDGTVVFYAAALDNSSEGLYTGPNPATDALAVRGTLANPTQFAEVNHDFTTINRDGVVAFLARQNAGGWGIFTAERGGPVNTLVTDAGPFSVLGAPAINDAGRVVFYGETDSGVKGIFRGPDPVADLVAAQGTGPGAAYFSLASYADIGGDTVVFEAQRPNGAHGVFTGPDPVADRVLAIGDTLFGSRVTNADFARGGINELGQIAVNYRLEDGRVGIVIATPVPEPAGAMVAVIAGGFALARRRGR